MHKYKIIIIGGVAAGTSVAAKLRRNDDNSVTIKYEKTYKADIIIVSAGVIPDA